VTLQSATLASSSEGTRTSDYRLVLNPEAPVTAKATITPLQVTTTANALSKVYDGTTTASAPALGLALAPGQVIEGDELSITASNAQYNSKDVLAANAVRFDSALGGKDLGNYALAESAIQSVEGSITPRPLTLQADDVTKDVDNVPFALSPTDLRAVNETSFAAEETVANLTGTLLAGPAQNQVSAGVYAIQPSGLASPNYAVSFNPSELTIAAASTPAQENPKSPTNPGDITGTVPGAGSTPFNTDLTGDLLAQLPPTAAGEEEDEEARKARYRRERSPLRVMDGGINTGGAATPQ
jgi:YDG domain/MBG domain (YGX type)